VTVQDITDRANLGRATFYLHFKIGKDQLLMSSLREMFDDLKSRITTPSPDIPVADMAMRSRRVLPTSDPEAGGICTFPVRQVARDLTGARGSKGASSDVRGGRLEIVTASRPVAAPGGANSAAADSPSTCCQAA